MKVAREEGQGSNLVESGSHQGVEKNEIKKAGHPPAEIQTPLGTFLCLDGNSYFEPPKMLLDDFLIESSINDLAGPRKSGKGWIALCASKQIIEEQRGNVIYLDRENGKRRMDQRISSLRTDPLAWRRSFRYGFNPPMTDKRESVELFEKSLDQLKPSLVVVDSWAGFLNCAGLDENISDDVTTWSELYLTPLRNREITTLILDHVPHKEKRPRGSARKGETVDTLFYLTKKADFDRTVVGEINLELLASRDGLLPKNTRYRVGGENGRFVFQKLNQKVYGLSGKKAEIVKVLEEVGDKGMTNSEWQKACEQKKLSKSTFQNYVKQLKNHEFQGQKLLKREGNKYHLNTLGEETAD
jgi:hypothetical protein